MPKSDKTKRRTAASPTCSCTEDSCVCGDNCQCDETCHCPQCKCNYPDDCNCDENCHCQDDGTCDCDDCCCDDECDGNCQFEQESKEFTESLKKMSQESQACLENCKQKWDGQPEDRKKAIKKGLVTGLAVVGGLYALKKIFGSKK